MYFEHSTRIWREFPELVAGVLVADGISGDVTGEVSVTERLGRYHDIAAARLESGPEGEFPEIRAWRRAFSRMGLKPTQYRCASEALLRRFRKEKSLPSVHPLVDVCNAVSLAFAVPVAVFDIAGIAGHLEVRHASGDESYLTFSGETISPEAGEVIFADAEKRVHARRWCNRQSLRSAVQDTTRGVLVVAEALHDSAATDVPRLLDAVAGEMGEIFSAGAKPTILGASSRRFDF
jgi:DNA/RNA-binding domain of Phe-tRNA-synthetase-like protein